MKYTSENTERERVKTLSTIVITVSKSLNRTLLETPVKPVFMCHYINLKTGKNGIEDMLADQLVKHGAISPVSGVFQREILQWVQAEFTKNSLRYPSSTIACYLTNSGGKFCKKHLFQKIETGTNPHFKWYYAGLKFAPK